MHPPQQAALQSASYSTTCSRKPQPGPVPLQSDSSRVEVEEITTHQYTLFLQPGLLAGYAGSNPFLSVGLSAMAERLTIDGYATCWSLVPMNLQQPGHSTVQGTSHVQCTYNRQSRPLKPAGLKKVTA